MTYSVIFVLAWYYLLCNTVFMSVTKVYVLRLDQKEIAEVVEALTTMKLVAADNEEFREEKRLGDLIQKILSQASKTERSRK